ncbi:coagulation factor II (thrombin) receptor-like 1, tandem duplicate 2 [Megalops cyprinoides]|uniref:coagulation factor II (thrombin) receptor-like 1, tandem duplicate 2 n=1 Tax=Megalops cyprinoides TaxID=118141 RepID=UPI001863BB35|nr:coagulation factor II (thrombin) receptor-like 1, tandem duplicate 2 [Megalops cyprinoides]
MTRLTQFTITLVCVFLTGAQTDVVKTGRGFIGIKDGQSEGSVNVGSAAAETLKSPLTTVFLPIVYIIVFAVGLPTNAMAIWVFLFRTKKKYPSAIYMANLALSDLLFVIWIPLKIAYHFNGNDWIYGEGLCKVLVGFFYANMYCSILFITCLSVQRYWVIAHPLSQQRKNNQVAIGISLAIWVFIWLSTAPLYLYNQTVKVSNLGITTCHDINAIGDIQNPFHDIKYPFSYFILMGVFVFFVPCVVTVIAYVGLLRTLGDSMSNEGVGKKRRKAVILTVTVLVTFLVCFVPSNIMLIVHYILLKDGVVNNGYGFYITTLCLASLNSCLDPFLYYYVSEDFRDHVKNTLLCRSSRTVERMRVSFSSMKYSKKANIYTSDTSNTQTSTC